MDCIYKAFIFTTWLSLVITTQLFAQITTNQYYYLGAISDARAQKNYNIGQIIAEKNTDVDKYLSYVQFENMLKNKFESNFLHNRDPYFVNIAVSKVHVQEEFKNTYSISGRFEFSGSFYIKTSEDSITLMPFKLATKYSRPKNDSQQPIILIDQQLHDLQGKLLAWFKENYAKNPKLARHVKVITSDYLPAVSYPDTLYYPQRPLGVSDFSPKPAQNKSNYAAMVFTNMGYEAKVHMSSDTVYLNIALKVYQVKGMSYIEPSQKTSRVLNHEQTHFDITQLVAERFKERLREEVLPAQDYDSRIQYLYLDYYRMINRLQNDYDTDTHHGLKPERQQFWEQKIKTELSHYRNIH
jgi:hypothetical protein